MIRLSKIEPAQTAEAMPIVCPWLVLCWYGGVSAN
jgi:hypothetical protein